MKNLVHPLAAITAASFLISLAALPGMRDLTVTLNGMSKAYAMTGWRLGYLGAPAPLCEQILNVQQHVVTCAPSFVQAAGVASLQGPQGCVLPKWWRNTTAGADS